MSDVVFFDCESDCTFRDCPGQDRSTAFAYMQATIICALSVDAAACLKDGTDAVSAATKHSFWRDAETRQPFEPLLALFDDAAVIVAYNGLDFDFPLLFKYYARDDPGRLRYFSHRAKCFDPFSRIRAAFDHWPKLDKLLSENGVPTKTSTGLEAVSMWNDGRRDELLAYCTQDVESMAKLCLLGDLTYRFYGVAATIPARLVDVRCELRSTEERGDGEPFVLVA